jgi:hypothetical protein
MVGGSFAGSYYGFARNTQDADFIVSLKLDDVDAFVNAFSQDFYLDRGTIEDALRRRTSFNIIHFQSSFKVDFFMLRPESFQQKSFLRRQPTRLDSHQQAETLLQSAEDTVLAKLDWYRQGGEVSELQWRDVVGIMKVQSGRLDMKYTETWARELGVHDLLARALDDAGVSQK